MCLSCCLISLLKKTDMESLPLDACGAPMHLDRFCKEIWYVHPNIPQGREFVYYSRLFHFPFIYNLDRLKEALDQGLPLVNDAYQQGLEFLGLEQHFSHQEVQRIEREYTCRKPPKEPLEPVKTQPKLFPWFRLPEDSAFLEMAHRVLQPAILHLLKRKNLSLDHTSFLAEHALHLFQLYICILAVPSVARQCAHAALEPLAKCRDRLCAWEQLWTLFLSQGWSTELDMAFRFIQEDLFLPTNFLAFPFEQALKEIPPPMMQQETLAKQWQHWNANANAVGNKEFLQMMMNLLKPILPDGTSQIWPNEAALYQADSCGILWRFLLSMWTQMVTCVHSKKCCFC